MKKTKNLKRVLACLLAVLMCFSSIILSAAAGNSTQAEPFEYTMLEDYNSKANVADAFTTTSDIGIDSYSLVNEGVNGTQALKMSETGNYGHAYLSIKNIPDKKYLVMYINSSRDDLKVQFKAHQTNGYMLSGNVDCYTANGTAETLTTDTTDCLHLKQGGYYYRFDMTNAPDTSNMWAFKITIASENNEGTVILDDIYVTDSDSTEAPGFEKEEELDILYLDELETADHIKAGPGTCKVDNENKYSGTGSFSVTDTAGAATALTIYRKHDTSVDLSAVTKEGSKIVVYINPSTVTNVNYIEVRFYDERPINADFSINWSNGLWATGGLLYQIPASGLKPNEWNRIEIDSTTKAAYGSFTGVDWTKIKLLQFSVNKAANVSFGMNIDKLMIEGIAPEVESSVLYTDELEDSANIKGAGYGTAAIDATTKLSGNGSLSLSGPSNNSDANIVAYRKYASAMDMSAIEVTGNKMSFYVYADTTTNVEYLDVRFYDQNALTGDYTIDWSKVWGSSGVRYVIPSSNLKAGEWNKIEIDKNTASAHGTFAGVNWSKVKLIEFDVKVSADATVNYRFDQLTIEGVAPDKTGTEDLPEDYTMIEDYNNKTAVSEAMNTTDIRMGSYALAKEGVGGTQALKLTTTGNDYVYLSIKNIPSTQRYLVVHMTAAEDGTKMSLKPHMSGNNSYFFTGTSGDIYCYNADEEPVKLTSENDMITLKKGSYYYQFDMSKAPSGMTFSSMWALKLGLIPNGSNTVVVDNFFTTDNGSTVEPIEPGPLPDDYTMLENYDNRTNVGEVVATGDIGMSSYELVNQGVNGS
ncbi:MAG: hypothetical protein IJD11_02440, partial [Oscillospiraceae bacterium]|nr:hypothetical protein [Oscillospiraceae bacterium]